MNPFELFGKLVEWNVKDTITAGVSRDAPKIVGAVTSDFYPVGLALFAGTHAMAGGGILQVLGGTEAPAGGFCGGVRGYHFLLMP